MPLILEPYIEQQSRWPKTGQHIMAQFDVATVVVYQAYRPSIGHYAVANQHFGGGFSFDRMSWVKPNFLWMMYRSGWGTKPEQEVTLAIRLHRQAFDQLLAQAVHSTFRAEVYGDMEGWRKAVAESSVRLQWDPDHGPAGVPVSRRAIQLGLRGDVLKHYASDWIVEIEDISELVAQQRKNVSTPDLLSPRERIYPVADPAVRKRIGIDYAAQVIAK